MEKRITYVKNLLEQKLLDIEHIFLLTGERYALQSCHNDNDKCFVQQDGGIEYIKSLATKKEILPDAVTETHIMQDIYKRTIGLPEPYVINTPKGSKQRPDTFDTAIHFIQSKEFKKCHHTAFVSRAPNINAQYVAIQKAYVLKNVKTSFEMIGGSANKNELSNKTSAAYHILMPISGTIYGNYLNVCKKISVFQNHCTEEFLAKNLSYKSLKDKQNKLKKSDDTEDL
ncbi:MAG: hypothetical protein KBC27_03435 [Rickettsiales bacterium]|nr:hypothetical protein [Rickettsiales bacterium]